MVPVSGGRPAWGRLGPTGLSAVMADHVLRPPAGGADLRRPAAIGGRHGCTHITELLGPVATIAYQTLYGHDARERRKKTQFSDADKQNQRSHLHNSCVGYADDSVDNASNI